MALKRVWAGIAFNNNIYFSFDGKKPEKVKIGTDEVATAISYLREYTKRNKVKIVGAGIQKKRGWKEIFSRLWLELDISPFAFKENNKPAEKISQEASLFAKKQFEKDGSYLAKVGKKNKVICPPLVKLADYEAITPPKEFQLLLELSRKFEGKKITFFSATPQGGGVALMRHALMRLFGELGVKASWHVLTDDPEIFNITKRKFHNILQTVAETGESLTDDEKKKFDKWSKKNANKFNSLFKKSDVIVIDDPQPCGLVPLIRKVNPKIPIVYRSHIQLVAKKADKKGTPQNITWEFIWDKIKTCDLFVSHPKKEFVPKIVPDKKVVLMGAATDRLDGLNKEITGRQTHYYMNVLNILLQRERQTPLDLTRPYITQIARFDPSKGIPDLLEAYRILCFNMEKRDAEAPQLVIAGNSSVDDPDGLPIYNMAKEIISTDKYAKIKENIKLLRLPHYDQLLNVLLRESLVALQLSYKEGFEVKVTEALMKGKPVIAYKTGGIPLQIKDNLSGFLVKTGDIKTVSERLYELLTNKRLYQKMSIAAHDNIDKDANTISNAVYWLYLANKLLDKKEFSPNFTEMLKILP